MGTMIDVEALQFSGQSSRMAGCVSPHSISESVNSMKKKKFTVKVRKKPNERKTIEKILKVNMHKLRWYKHLKHTDQDWLSTVPNCA